MSITAMKQALDALKLIDDAMPFPVAKLAMTNLRQAIEQAQQPKYDTIELHVLHSHIAGVLFDFMGWLTSREKRLTLSSTDEAGPAVEAITEFAKMRGLHLEDAQVEHWQAILTTPQLQQAEKQEPVAWMHVQGNHEEPSFRELDDEEISRGWKQYPLYTTPQPQFGDTSAAYMVGVQDGKKQREWAGLTDEDIEQEFGFIDELLRDCVQRTEAKLKEKNNG